MNTAFRKPCFSAILCGAALLAPQARAQSADSAGILSTTPQSVEDLQRIEHQLQQVLPRVLPALVCIEVNNGSGTGILVSEKGLIFSAAHVVDKQGTVLKIILPDGTRYTIAVFIKDSAENPETNARIIADISETVYRYVHDEYRENDIRPGKKHVDQGAGIGFESDYFY